MLKVVLWEHGICTDTFIVGINRLQVELFILLKLFLSLLKTIFLLMSWFCSMNYLFLFDVIFSYVF